MYIYIIISLLIHVLYIVQLTAFSIVGVSTTNGLKWLCGILLLLLLSCTHSKSLL